MTHWVHCLALVYSEDSKDKQLMSKLHPLWLNLKRAFYFLFLQQVLTRSDNWIKDVFVSFTKYLRNFHFTQSYKIVKTLFYFKRLLNFKCNYYNLPSLVTIMTYAPRIIVLVFAVFTLEHCLSQHYLPNYYTMPQYFEEPMYGNGLFQRVIPIRHFGLPDGSAHSHDDFDKEKTVDERISARINPIPFVLNSGIRMLTSQLQHKEANFIRSPVKRIDPRIVLPLMVFNNPRKK